VPVYCLTMDWMTGRLGFNPRQRQKDFSSSICIQIGSGAHPVSCQMGISGWVQMGIQMNFWVGKNNGYTDGLLGG
jgi:hypothetical protein